MSNYVLFCKNNKLHFILNWDLFFWLINYNCKEDCMQYLYVILPLLLMVSVILITRKVSFKQIINSIFWGMISTIIVIVFSSILPKSLSYSTETFILSLMLSFSFFIFTVGLLWGSIILLIFLSLNVLFPPFFKKSLIVFMPFI